jgi:hypothetical protein
MSGHKTKDQIESLRNVKIKINERTPINGKIDILAVNDIIDKEMYKLKEQKY